MTMMLKVLMRNLSHTSDLPHSVNLSCCLSLNNEHVEISLLSAGTLLLMLYPVSDEVRNLYVGIVTEWSSFWQIVL